MREIRSPLDGILTPFQARAAAAVDAYAVQGLSPLLVADFTTPYYRKAGSTSTFDSTFTHSRGGNATMVDSDGLIKWAPHNLLLYSNNFNTGWVKNNLPATLNQDQPDYRGNANSAWTMVDNGAGGTGAVFLRQAITLKQNVTYTARVVAKKDNLSWMLLGFANFSDDNGSVYVNLDTGAKGTDTNNKGTVTPLGGGYYLIERSIQVTGADTSGNLLVYVADGDGDATVDLDGTSSIIIERVGLYRSDLGGMVNNPDRGDSYVPTTTAAVYQARRNHYTYNGTSWINSGLLLETEARTNLLYGTNTLATQTYTTTAVPHTLSFTGTGTVTLSGSSTAGPLVGTGTGENNRVNLTFTPTAAGLTLTVTGTVTNAQLEIGSTPSSYTPNLGGVGTTATRPTESLQIAAADMPWDASNVSLQMNGKITYADEGVEAQQTFARWYDDASNYITIDLDTDSTDTGEVNFEQQDGTGGTGTVTADTYSPGILVPYNIASRNTSTAINGATDGTAGTEDTTPTALPDLSAKDFSLGYDYMGTIAQFRAWNVDIGDTGIEDATS